MSQIKKQSVNNETKDELRSMLRAKIGEKRISRSSKRQKESILGQTLKEIGVDKEKFKQDLEAIKKQGGLQLDIKRN